MVINFNPSADKLFDVVTYIRRLAKTNQFEVVRENKKQDWKNAMLRYLSDDVVLNHLRYLHPFQYFGCNPGANVYEFQVQFYKNHAYIKVDLNKNRVLPFHYDEDPGNDEEISHIRTSVELPEIIPIIVDEDYAKAVAYFAIGAQVIQMEVYPSVLSPKEKYIRTDDWWDMLTQRTHAGQREFLSKLTFLERYQIRDLVCKSAPNDFDILSIVDNDLQMISICQNIWCKYRRGELVPPVGLEMTQFLNLTVDLLFRENDETKIREFLNTMHPTQQYDFPKRFDWLDNASELELEEVCLPQPLDNPDNIDVTSTSLFSPINGFLFCTIQDTYGIWNGNNNEPEFYLVGLTNDQALKILAKEYTLHDLIMQKDKWNQSKISQFGEGWQYSERVEFGNI